MMMTSSVPMGTTETKTMTSCLRLPLPTSGNKAEHFAREQDGRVTQRSPRLIGKWCPAMWMFKMAGVPALNLELVRKEAAVPPQASHPEAR